MGVEFVHYTGDDGALRSIRRGWTSVACEDPFVWVRSDRSAFRVSDLLALGSLLGSLEGAGRAGRDAEGGAGTVKLLPARCSGSVAGVTGGCVRDASGLNCCEWGVEVEGLIGVREHP